MDSISFHVNQGEIFGFLGPNGAGKSTTIKILLGIIFADSGEAELLGQKVGTRETKRRIGFLPENPYFYDYLTSSEFLTFHGRLWGMSDAQIKTRIPEVLQIVGMRGTEEMRLRSFSKGMLQRIGLAQAILHDPDFVILDEPMTGLDPLGRKEVRDLMLQLRSMGKTVFFSTHILSDVEAICDRVAILNKGRLLSCGSLKDLISVESKYADLVLVHVESELESWLREQKVEELLPHGTSIYCKLRPQSGESQESFERRLNAMLSEILKRGGRVQSLTHRQDSLEDVFVKQIGQLESRV